MIESQDIEMAVHTRLVIQAKDRYIVALEKHIENLKECNRLLEEEVRLRSHEPTNL